ncbi:hypothetical protein SAMN02800692_2027 [Luteibacter sp. UNC138MFCol5.1]|uniref:hypothetical protein n=1 Tax=Luteibacter sp. UNC138MFCol5.1 TaxID=1502774 RepID=UPI0008B52055|nr:hypothetical protein [Luteibacter sp. UNC138MFCol5.1]SEO76925.1 hypothetical protein SAMN02800692_2027 [Luteibacter sp. UNC138MFCol5.1]
MSTVVPPTHMQYARRIRRYGRQNGVTEAEMRAAIKSGIPLLTERTPESVSYEYGRRFRDFVPTGSTAA